jgi:mRNA interferase RelE/StbE
MASYKVILRPSIHKDLCALPKTAAGRVFQQIEDLKDNPLPRQSIKLSGAEHLYRIRVSDYRIIYEIELEAKEISVLYVRHRRDVYRSI